MNKVIIMGRLTKDIEGKTSSNGKLMARFTLAVDNPYNKEHTDFLNCVAFGKTVEVLQQYTDKGKRVIVDGRIQTGSYEKDGQKVYTTDIMVNNVQIVDFKQTDAIPW